MRLEEQDVGQPTPPVLQRQSCRRRIYNCRPIHDMRHIQHSLCGPTDLVNCCTPTGALGPFGPAEHVASEQTCVGLQDDSRRGPP